MREEVFTVLANRPLTDQVFEITLEGNAREISLPGQFVNVKLDGLFLRRPISVCDHSDVSLTLIYKVVGKGTALLSGKRPGDRLDLLLPLGNGFDPERPCKKPLLIGGGVGTPPLYGLCKALLERGKKPRVILGFNSGSEVFYEEEFRALGVPVTVTTADGSCGVQGFVTDAMEDLDYDFFYACGPLPMFRAVERTVRTTGQYSFEERMGCGFGACMGCTCQTKEGPKRVCREGPVFDREVVEWND